MGEGASSLTFSHFGTHRDTQVTRRKGVHGGGTRASTAGAFDCGHVERGMPIAAPRWMTVQKGVNSLDVDLIAGCGHGKVYQMGVPVSLGELMH
ncbi:hypothetical protein HYQ46_011884 [Verticillium longisporum]|nr:hypothetical protein HYQ46_011884 [Verticillium longisporum]